MFFFCISSKYSRRNSRPKKVSHSIGRKGIWARRGRNKGREDKESFLHGKRRIEDAIKNEKVDLEAEGKDTSEKLEELYILQEKYNKVLEEYNNLSEEKEKLLLENKSYQEKIQKGMK